MRGWVDGSSGRAGPGAHADRGARADRDGDGAPPPAELRWPAEGGLAGWFARRGIRADPGRRVALAVGALALVAALLAGRVLWHRPPQSAALGPPSVIATVSASSPTPLGSSGGTVASTRSAAATTADPGLVLVVDVAGKVRHPGVYRLPAGSRVDDALRAAGGALPGVDLTMLNLAAPLADGQQIAVGVAGASAAAPAAGAASPTGGDQAGGGALVNINTADQQQLESLPGIGPVLAQHILDWRAAHGSFGSVEQLQEVSGIGSAKFAQLKPLVTV